MAISGKIRKALWARSGNRCAMCKAELAVEGTSPPGQLVVGEECHIVSGAPSGPRYDPVFPKDEIDSYPNLILLCPRHHKTVDENADDYTPDVLREKKAQHEKWVSERLGDRPKMPKLAIKGRAGRKLLLQYCGSGKDLLGMCQGFHSYAFSYDEPRSSLQVELLAEFGDFLDEVDLVDELGPGYAVRTASQISDCLGMLEAQGMRVFAGVDRGKLEVDGEEAQDWLVLVVHIAHEDSANIRKAPKGGCP
ncbi:MAG: HNH endonuclease [Candidatus Coatesbacteria bacterium]|nr:HNH endonuclease [Candidatus Coatesbacteria bacterium]